MTALKIQLDMMEEKFTFIKEKYTIYNITEPTLNEKYGIINIIKIILDNKGKNNLVVVPGYSLNSTITIFEKILEGFDYIKDAFNAIYIINWGNTLVLCTKDTTKSFALRNTIKELSENITKGLTDMDEIYLINENFRIDLAIVLDKIIRKINIINITLLGKSAGGGISIYLAEKDVSNIKQLLLCCPATINGGKPLKDRRDLQIKLSWNEDDNKIPFQTYMKFEEDFKKQKNKYKIYLYKTGGHELNAMFLKDIF